MSIVAIDSLQMVADSIRQVEVADSLHRIFVADSLAQVRMDMERIVFGEGSTLSQATTMAGLHDTPSSVDAIVTNPIYIIIAVAFSLLYLIWLPHIIKGGQIKWSQLKPHRHVDGSEERYVVGRQRLGMVVASWSLAITFFALFSGRVVAQYIDSVDTFDSVEWMVGAIAAIIAVALYEWAILKVGGYLSLNIEFVKKIFSMKRQLMVLCIIFASPLFIMCGVASYKQGEWILQLSMIVGIVFLVAFIRQSFLLFMRQKISILHWFLYLCGVEILPLTFLWAFSARYILI
ncbi:MAG: DUF4271 domain-containing protein [Rikenellaceae bacterium]